MAWSRALFCIDSENFTLYLVFIVPRLSSGDQLKNSVRNNVRFNPEKCRELLYWFVAIKG
jgi:hypothetical protein